MREFLSFINRCFFERVDSPGPLNRPDPSHPDWVRHTAFLGIWDDYHKDILGISMPEESIAALAMALLTVFRAGGNQVSVRTYPATLAPHEFGLIRLVHATQDFTQVLPAIDGALIQNLKAAFSGQLPTPHLLSTQAGADKVNSVLGGADRNVDERLRYIQGVGRTLTERYGGEFQRIYSDCDGDAARIFAALCEFPGIKSKKANMLLRDFMAEGVWTYRTNTDVINIIADNRVMRIALRTGIVRLASGRPFNNLIDQYDLQYVSLVRATEEAFRKVWLKCRDLNGGVDIVSSPAGFDRFLFDLGDGRSGCCRPNARSCETGRKPKKFYAWMKTALNYETLESCPFNAVCRAENKILNAPYAIQNNTWNSQIFTNAGGGGGVRGV
ncbi:MAG: hypothetical protein AB1725_09770 [Armatimonadota bacterium]